MNNKREKKSPHGEGSANFFFKKQKREENLPFSSKKDQTDHVNLNEEKDGRTNNNTNMKSKTNEDKNKSRPNFVSNSRSGKLPIGFNLVNVILIHQLFPLCFDWFEI